MRVATGAPMTQSNVAIQKWAPRIGGQAWAVVLAGGKGMRLRGLTRHVYGEDRPKQYAVLTGGTSLLRQTLDRVRLCIPPERTVVVTMAGQGGYMRAELRHEPRPRMCSSSQRTGARRRPFSSPPTGSRPGIRKPP